MKRPMLWVFVFLVCLFACMRMYAGRQMDARCYAMDSFLQASNRGIVCGTLQRVEAKPKSYYLYFSDVSVKLNSLKKIFSFSDFLVILTNYDKNKYFPGNRLEVHGLIQTLESPRNPGQFDEKSYYREKNIYYKMSGDTIICKDNSKNIFLSSFSTLQDQWKKVYEQCLPEKEAGILSAMLLGDKSTLDLEIKELYQTTGISHLLAISGLHLSILGMLFCKLLEYGHIRGYPALFLLLGFLISYDGMTGFGISTNRAVLMLFMAKLAGQTGRSYDGITALALSACIILFQKPYAITSCSFLLSYSAVLGIYCIQPVLYGLFLGTSTQQERRRRKNHLSDREKRANSRFPALYIFILHMKETVFSCFIASLSIWIATLPVMLYFFYEIPLYGILLNLFVLPLASILVILGFAGGICGIIWLPAGKCILFFAKIILLFYETLCRLFLKLPSPVYIAGCPKIIQILIYILIIAEASVFTRWLLCNREEILWKHRILPVISFLAALFLIFYRPPVNDFQSILVDVGQGDGILLRSDTGKTLLIDGGSSSVSNVGKYRLIPLLKYYGIRRIDYMIMTHEDEDHISGQRELFENTFSCGISIGHYLVPVPDKTCVGDNYHEMLSLAEKAGVPVHAIQTGDRLNLGRLSLTCLHPDMGFVADSANAYSTTIELHYGNCSMLLTGDLEKNGEEAVLSRLSSCDILKVAHHGSKNSSSPEYLNKIHPKVALISSGKNNRYGHPHQELLDRLRQTGAHIFDTADDGAVFLSCNGNRWSVQSFISSAG